MLGEQLGQSCSTHVFFLTVLAKAVTNAACSKLAIYPSEKSEFNYYCCGENRRNAGSPACQQNIVARVI